MNNKIDIII